MKHIWSILCEKSVVDKDTNLISIFNSLEQISFQTRKKNDKKKIDKKVLPIKYEIVHFFADNNKNSLRSAELKIDLFDPANKKIQSFIQKFEIPKGLNRTRIRTIIGGLPITKSGEYLFKINIKEKGSKSFKFLAEIPLEVTLQNG